MSDVSEWLAALLVILFFILGMVVMFLLVFLIPTLNQRLGSWRESLLGQCRCNRDTGSDSKQTTHEMSVLEKKQSINYYAEIDESKTQTLAAAKGRQKTDVKRKGSKKSKQANALVFENNTNTTNNPTGRQLYEDVDISNKRFSNHTYCIVDPGTRKRLPLKLLDDKRKSISSDENHLYFVLEPGTNKVTPVFQNIAQGSQGVQMDSDHTYFVLESTEEVFSSLQAEPYAVNDVSGDHNYFVLEREGN